MKFNPTIHHRRSIRLQGYDYSRPGTYFITICTHDQEYLFGNIIDDVMHLNDMGQVIAESWEWLADQYGHISLGEWVIMPNHLHGLIVITDDYRGGSRTAPTGKCKPVGQLIGAFKTVSTKRINEMRQTPGAKLWQRNFWEHIVRDESEWHRIRQYIQNNPAQWRQDQLNHDATTTRKQVAAPIDE